ncbi:MAG TPA: hypothetical protein VHV30_10190, partial [Polyangiaceae bacterium]|nr:hypothetical protein [Polyangiaceae bacterium]
MIPQEVQAALATLAARLADRSQMDEAVLGRWRAGRRSRATERPGTELPEDVRMAADRVKLALPALTRSEGGAAALAEVLGGPSGEAL